MVSGDKSSMKAGGDFSSQEGGSPTASRGCGFAMKTYARVTMPARSPTAFGSRAFNTRGEQKTQESHKR